MNKIDGGSHEFSAAQIADTIQADPETGINAPHLAGLSTEQLEAATAELVARNSTQGLRVIAELIDLDPEARMELYRDYAGL